MNNDIRIFAKESGVKLWQIADALNINNGNFSRRLRKSLTKEENEEMMTIIKK